MKDEDILLYGGIALAAYFLFIKKPATTPVTLLPTTSTGLLSPTQPVTTSASPVVSSIANALSNLFGGSSNTPNPANNIQTSTPGGETFTSTGTPAPIVTPGITDPGLFSSGVPQITMPSSDTFSDDDFEAAFDEETGGAISGPMRRRKLRM